MTEMIKLGILVYLFLLCITRGNLQLNNEPPLQPSLTGVVEEEVCSANPHLVFESPLRIGAWNTQRLGKRKVGNATLANYFAQIISRYDIIVLQEVVDVSQEAIYELLKIVNEVAFRSSDDYDDSKQLTPAPAIYNVIVSERVGKTSYKEQYAYFYRIGVVSINDSIQYPDDADDFSYPPFIVVFNTPTIDLPMITFVSLHASPKVAPEEIDSLIKVGDYIKEELHMNDIMFLGDFNAGCSYVTSNDWESLRFFLDERFTWLISDHIDTTTKYSTCPYDRIVISGKNLADVAYENSAKAFHFDDELEITNADLVEDISDHFPVEVLLKGKVKTNHTISFSVTVGFSQPSPYTIENYFNHCLHAKLFDNEFVEIMINCPSTTTPGNRLLINKLLVESFFLYGNDYINHTANELNETCIGEEWKMRYPAFQESLLKCGGRPFYMNVEQNVKTSGILLKNIQSLIDVMEKMTSIQGCIFTNEIYVLLRHKLESGAIRDSSIFMEENPNVAKMLSLYCLYRMCFISASSDIPIM